MKPHGRIFRSLPSPFRLFFVILTIIVLAEATVVMLRQVLMSEAHTVARSITDAAMLTVLIAPLLWWFIVRPLWSTALAEHIHAATVVRHAVDGIITINEQGVVESFNPAAERIFGVREEEVVGKPLTLLMPERYRDGHRRGLERVRLTGESRLLGRTVELHGLRKDGQEFPLELSVTPWKLEKRAFYTGIVRDISERKALEREAAFRGECLKALFTAAPAGLAILDGELRYLQVNETLARMNGLTVEEHLGRPVRDVLPKLAPIVEPVLQRILASGEPALNIEVSGETPLQPGIIRHWVASYFPVTMEEGASRGIGAIVVEITELKRAAEELKRLYDETDRRRQEAETFAALLQDLTGSLDLNQVLARLVEKAQALSQGDFAFLALVEADGHTLTIRAQAGAASSSLPGLALTKGRGMAGRVLETGEPLVTDDYLQDPRFSHDYDAVAQAEGTMAQVAVPILHEGTPLGVLLVARRTPRPFTPEDVQVLTLLADAASLACHQALLYQQATRRAAVLEHLWEVGQALTQSLALPETLDRIVHAAYRLLRVEYARLTLWDETTHCLILAAWAGGETLPRHQVFHLGEGIAGTVAATHQSLIVNDYQAFPHRLPELTAVTAAMAVPLLIEGRFIGTLSVGSTQPGRTFTAEDLQLLELLAQPAASALENARLHEQVKRHAEELERKVEERTQALKVANAQLAAASHHKSEFLASMSHELRTPLNSIIGFSELLQDQSFGPLNEKQQRYVHNILISGKHLLALINDILDLSKVEAGKLEFRPEPFDLKEALEGGLTVVASAASKKNLTLSLEVDRRLSTLTADPARFKQILYNLLSNAVKFTPEGGRVTVVARPVEDAFVEIRVQDTGIGIRSEDLPKLFREFTQVGSPLSRPYEGTGLGLALTKKLVERQGGRIWAESEGEGKGSTFTFLLPLKREEARG